MELKKATAVNKDDLYSFISQHEHLAITRDFNEKTSYVIEDEGSIISWFQLEQLDSRDVWLKKLFIVQNEALKLPNVLHSIIQFANENDISTIYVQSKQLVTDLLLSSFSFRLQPSDCELPLQLPQQGSWWSYSFSNQHIS